MIEKFTADQIIIRREILDGREWITYPVRVVADQEELLAVYLAQGTPMSFGGGEFRWGIHPWASMGAAWQSEGVLQLQRPGDGYSVWLFRKGGKFSGWYVNFQEPFRRTPTGFDTLDQELDIWIPQGSSSFQWKDADEFEERARSGGFTSEEAEAVRAESRKVVKMIEAAETWWQDWENWVPSSHWSTPEPVPLGNG
ncbi:DUF402 domain-containing protein [Streptomyces sp. NPDC053728]|uniref:DUF402 domain-containing protein n=1 Tax=Streptomyces sp. NPDC053728 TaxID=3155534 RepID=UPI0034450CC7